MIGLYLNAIVKDETPILERFLRAVAPHVAGMTIVDTGSTDGTQRMASELMASLCRKSMLYERPWVDFATNRTEALELARRDGAERVLYLDADETLSGEIPELSGPAYLLTRRKGAIDFKVLNFLDMQFPWKFVDVLHEYPICPCPTVHEVDMIDSPIVLCHDDGVRGREDAKTKYLRDAAILERELERDPHDRRHWFYLAQSYRDAGDVEKARIAYRHRATAFKEDDEEKFHAYFQLALIEDMHDKSEKAPEAYMRAIRLMPWRAEPLTCMSHHWRLRKKYHEAYLAAQRAVWCPEPQQEFLWVIRDMYTWGRWDELACAAACVGKKSEAIAIWDWLLETGRTPKEHHERTMHNIFLAQEEMKEPVEGFAWR